MKPKLENGRIMVRQVRQQGLEEVKKEFDGREDDIKRLDKEIQKLVDDTMSTIDHYGKQKEQELLQI